MLSSPMERLTWQRTEGSLQLMPARNWSPQSNKPWRAESCHYPLSDLKGALPPIESWDDYSPCQHPDGCLVRNPEPGDPAKLLTHRNCEILNAVVLSHYIFERIRYIVKNNLEYSTKITSYWMVLSLNTYITHFRMEKSLSPLKLLLLNSRT